MWFRPSCVRFEPEWAAALLMGFFRAALSGAGVCWDEPGSDTRESFRQAGAFKSRVDGQLMAVNYKEGQEVQKGDPLVEIDTGPYQAAVAGRPTAVFCLSA